MDEQQLRQFICDEVARQMQPLETQIEDVKRQNREQTVLASMQVRKIDDVAGRLKSLYGNGSGTPGFLEISRKQDDERYDELFDMVDRLNTERLREEGKAQALRELDQQKDKRLAAWQKWAGLFAIPALSTLWNIVHPLVIAFIRTLPR